MKRALTGITGQAGSHPAERLLGEKYETHGVIRRASTLDNGRIDALHQESARQRGR